MIDGEPPHSAEAEAAAVGAMLANPKAIPDVVGTRLEPDDFYRPAYRIIYAELQQAYYADEPTDPITIAERVKRDLATIATGGNLDEAVAKVKQLARARSTKGRDAAEIIIRNARLRSILQLTYNVQADVVDGKDDPEELAGALAHEAMRIATSSMVRDEFITFDELRDRIIERKQVEIAARAQGVEIGAFFGRDYIDHFVRGGRPGELMFVAGEPGVGKSAVVWDAATQFAERQRRNPKERRVACGVYSLEMGEETASDRVVQTVTHLDGGKMRESRLERADLQKIVDDWERRKDLPLIFNFTPGMKSHQLRASVVEGIRRYNMGVVIVDHLRYLHHPAPPGQRWSTLEAEEDLVRFLTQDIARQLNVFVICLAHTVKAISDDGRPRMRDLRGGQMVQAHASHIGFVYRPYLYASDEAVENGDVKRTDAEMIWEKTRFSGSGSADFYFDASTMTLRDP